MKIFKQTEQWEKWVGENIKYPDFWDRRSRVIANMSERDMSKIAFDIAFRKSLHQMNSRRLYWLRLWKTNGIIGLPNFPTSTQATKELKIKRRLRL